MSQSQAGRAAGGKPARMRRSSGAWKVASWQSSARARARTRSRGPVSARTPSRRSGTVTGASGSRPACRTSASAAASSAGSRSTSGPPGASSRIGAAGGTGPRPTRTVRKSSSAGRRSHSRSARQTSVHWRGGSGGGGRRRRAGRRPGGRPWPPPAPGGRGSGTAPGAWPGGRPAARPVVARAPAPARRSPCRRRRPPARGAWALGRRAGTPATRRRPAAAPGTAARRPRPVPTTRPRVGPPPAARGWGAAEGGRERSGGPGSGQEEVRGESRLPSAARYDADPGRGTRTADLWTTAGGQARGCRSPLLPLTAA